MIAECHPHREIYCRELCRQCYNQQYYDTNKERWTREHGYVAIGGEPIIPICGHPDKKHHANGLCGPCYNKTPKRAKAIKNYTAINARRDQLKHRYDITPEEYDRLNAKQHGLCAICHQPPRGKMKRLSVDHNHTTNSVRGLLCITCNRHLGFHENVEWRNEADAYLAKHSN